MLKRSGIILLCVIGLIGCNHALVSPQQFSGFLGDDYARLQPTISLSGQPVLRWISPQLTPQNYRQVILEPTQFYPAPKTSDKVYTNLFPSILSYMDTSLNQQLSALVPVVTQAAPQTLRFRLAITGVGVSTDAAFWEEDATMSVEYEVTDAITGQLLAAGVKKGFGKSINKSYDAVTIEDLAPVMKTWALDARLFFEKFNQ